jgi:undecaprenyl diphosphate synthase
VGRLEGISDDLKLKFITAELTKHNVTLFSTSLLTTAGEPRLNAVRRIIATASRLSKSAKIGRPLSVHRLSDPDLIIRTSGEFRTNFLIWRAAYAEYHVTPTYWPDFDKGAVQGPVGIQPTRRRFGQCA